jgi:hypothetical protein
MKSPRHTPLLPKTFGIERQTPQAILDKEIVDEMISNRKDKRNGLILELHVLSFDLSEAACFLLVLWKTVS